MFDLATFDRFFETMLRNKGNMFLVGTVPLPGQLPPHSVLVGRTPLNVVFARR